MEQVNDNIRERVEDALENIRPYLETDGGDIKILEINDEMVVRLELLGGMWQLSNVRNDFKSRSGRINQKSCS